MGTGLTFRQRYEHKCLWPNDDCQICDDEVTLFFIGEAVMMGQTPDIRKLIFPMPQAWEAT